MRHTYAHCPSLQQQRERVDQAAQAYMDGAPIVWRKDARKGTAGESDKGGKKKEEEEGPREALEWRQLPEALRVRLLLGDMPAGQGPAARDPWRGSREQWTKGLVEATIGELGELMACRNAVIRELVGTGALSGGK